MSLEYQHLTWRETWTKRKCVMDNEILQIEIFHGRLLYNLSGPLMSVLDIAYMPDIDEINSEAIEWYLRHLH